MNLTEKLEASRIMAIQLSELKKAEMSLRLEIAQELGGPRGPGTYNFEMDGLKVKLKLSNNTSLDQEELNTAIEDDRLTDEEKELIRWKGDLKMADYKKADFETDNLDELIIVKPSAPTLTIEIGEL